MSKKSARPPKRQPLAEATAEALAPTPSAVPAEPAPPAADAGQQIAIDARATQLVRQGIADLIAAQPPTMQAIAKERFEGFMERCVVLAPPKQ
jgi:hypothetical protein